jgi:hypothetical protein
MSNHGQIIPAPPESHNWGWRDQCLAYPLEHPPDQVQVRKSVCPAALVDGSHNLRLLRQCSQLWPDENNKASSLTNLFRNWGGSFGIAFITAASDRRVDLLLSVWGSSLDSVSRALQQGTQSLVSQLIHYGYSSADAGAASLGIVYDQLVRQSLFLAFMDCFRVIGLLNILAIPLIFAIRKFKSPREASAGH